MKLVDVTQGAYVYKYQSHRRTPSQQVSSELHVPTQQWEYKAGVSEEAGRVIEPRNMYSRGQQDNLSGIEGKADGLQAPEGSSPGCGMASAQDTTGV